MGATEIPVAKRRPTLLNAAEVAQLVRQFAARVLFLRAAFHAGEPGADRPLETIEHEARSFSAALSLTPHGRAYWMVALPEQVKEFGVVDPGAGLFMWIAGQTVQMMQAIEDGEPEAEIKPQIERMLNDIIARLTAAKY
ncbi:hypothetical protein PQR14_22115 [Paraburkholderia bryophila]|uniref:hypothetical protein n=1 Tax=Paraburkholderia bryophila TaxID=420952 RepID=UPI0038BBAE3B